MRFLGVSQTASFNSNTPFDQTTKAQLAKSFKHSEHKMTVDAQYGAADGRYENFVKSTRVVFWNVNKSNVVNRMARSEAPRNTREVFFKTCSCERMPTEVSPRSTVRIQLSFLPVDATRRDPQHDRGVDSSYDVKCSFASKKTRGLYLHRTAICVITTDERRLCADQARIRDPLSD